MAKEKQIKDSWEYETKCRRCGKLTEWHFGLKKDIPHARLTEWINSALVTPRMHWCDKCKKDTIQDIVSYTMPFN